MNYAKLQSCLCFVCCLLVAVLGACTNEQNSPVKKIEPVSTKVTTTTALLATIAENEGPVSSASNSSHTKNSTMGTQQADIVIDMNQLGKGVAYIVKVGEQVRVVHNGKPGKLYSEIESHTLSLSPDGKRVAYGAKVGDKWMIVDNEAEYGPFDDKSKPTFSPDSKQITYTAKTGEMWHVFVNHKKKSLAVSYYDSPLISNNSEKLFILENTADESLWRIVISDLNFKKVRSRNVKTNSYKVNAGRTMVAAIDKEESKQRVVEMSFEKPDAVKQGPLYDEVSNLTYNQDGSVLAYVAKKDGVNYAVMNGKEEKLPGEAPWPLVIRPDHKGVALFIVNGKRAYLHQPFFDNGIKNGVYKEGNDLTYSSDSRHLAYVAIKNEQFLIVVDGKEGPVFDRVISPQFSPDGRYLVYRARQNGKRFVVVADPNGKVLKQHPGYERVFEVVFTADGKSVAYGVKDGKQLAWKVEALP